MAKSTRFSIGRIRGPVVLLLHLSLLLAFVGAGAYRVHSVTAGPGLPALRPAPLQIPPLYDVPTIVTDEQLQRVLYRLRPQFPDGRVRVGPVDHYLRMWGVGARFEDPQLLSGHDMLKLLTDHRRFADVFGHAEPPLLVDTGTGVRVNTFRDGASSPHIDHLLASLLEIGIPLDFPITTPSRAATLRSIAEQSLRDFTLNQPEYEWSALSFALIVLPTSGWYSSEGQKITFDRLAVRLMREDLPRGVDWATHRLFSLTVLVRIHDMTASEGAPLLSDTVWHRSVAYLRDATAAFVRNQHVDGFWNGEWASATPATSKPTDRARDRLSDRIIVTGHALEWWALAPAYLLPPQETLDKAGQWLVRTIDALTPDEIVRYQSFLSHAGRALALWRGRVPGDVIGVEETIT